MTFGSILLGLALLVAVSLFVTRPLFSRDPRRRGMSEYKALSIEKEAILVEIRTLDFDYETGKVDQAEYEQQREAYVTEAADLLMRIDAIDETYLETEAPAAGRQPEAEYDEIEAAIARRRAKVAAVPASSKADVAADVDSQNGHSSFCPQCGEPADASDRFCAHCGHQLTQPQHA
jgi:NADH pyrophosphatase NudC (nudix superfamily)